MIPTPRTDAFAADDNGDPKEAYQLMRELERKIAVLRADMHRTAQVFDYQDTIGGEFLPDYVRRMVGKLTAERDAARAALQQIAGPAPGTIAGITGMGLAVAHERTAAAALGKERP